MARGGPVYNTERRDCRAPAGRSRYEFSSGSGGRTWIPGGLDRPGFGSAKRVFYRSQRKGSLARVRQDGRPDAIPAGTQTLSKGPNQFVMGITPKYLKKGKGSHVWDVDGNEYIDYPLALGPILLGYDYAPVSEAVINQVKEGTTFTLMHPLEVEVAELLSAVIPCAEMTRFGKNGADVTSAAVKVARAATGKDHIAYCGYHWSQDWYAVVTPRNKGIPAALKDYMHPFEYNRIETLEKLFAENPGKIGCVIREVPGTDPVVDLKTGRDTLILHYGPSADFATHYRWLPTNRWGVEAIANLDELPAKGATLIVGSPTIAGATGGPCRLIALVPGDNSE